MTDSQKKILSSVTGFGLRQLWNCVSKLGVFTATFLISYFQSVDVSCNERVTIHEITVARGRSIITIHQYRKYIFSPD